MKNKLMKVLVASVLLANVCNADESADAWEYARNAWPKDKSMQKYYVKKQVSKISAYGNLKAKYKNKIDNEKAYRLIIKICDNESKGDVGGKIYKFEYLAKKTIKGSIDISYLKERSEE